MSTIYVLLQFTPEEFTKALAAISALSQQATGNAIAYDFASLFDDVPDDKIAGVFVEGGEYNCARDKYPFESSADLKVAPDGSVWAKVAERVDALPKGGGG